MEVINVNIKTKDPGYGKVLQEVLVRNYRGFVVSLETNPEDERAHHYADLCLVDSEQWWGEEDVLLVDSPGLEQLDPAKGKTAVFRFTPARSLIGKLLQILSRKRGYQIFYQEESAGKIIAVGAASGGLGTTVTALTLAREFATTWQKQVIYLNLEQFPSQGVYVTGEPGVLPLRQLLFEAMQQGFRGDGYGRLTQCLWQESLGVSYFTMAPGENPLVELTKEDMTSFLHWMGLQSGSLIVADVGNALTGAAASMVEAADHMLFLVGAESRDRIYQKVLAKHGGSGVVQKTLWIHNHMPPSDAGISEGPLFDEAVFESLWKEGTAAGSLPHGDCYLPHDEESFVRKENGMEISMAGAFGAAVAKVAAKLSRPE